MLHSRSHWFSFAVMLAWIGLAAGCSLQPVSPAAPASTPSSSSSSGATFGVALPPAASQFAVEPTVFSFPNTAIGTTSPINAVATLTGIGNAIQLVAIVSSNPSEFPVTTTCSLSVALAPNTACLVTTQFRPSSTGTRSAQITITTANAGRVSVALSGTGALVTLSPIVISPESFLFPNTVAGSTSFTSAVITLTNTGTVAIDLSVITSSNPIEFPITTTCNVPGSLAAGASCTVSVQFRPIAGGTRSAQMLITTSDAGTGTFSVSGAGI